MHRKKERKKIPVKMRVEADCFALCLPLTEDAVFAFAALIFLVSFRLSNVLLFFFL